MYVVTGSTGRTGRVIARRLLAKGQQVRVVGRRRERLQFLVEDGAEPFVADFTDAAKLTEAFRDSEGVYAMIPPDLTNEHYRDYQEKVSDSIATALRDSGAPRVVVLSSVGADKPSGTGPVVGLHNLEQKLSKIDGLDALFLRAAYFMENTLGQAGAIHALGFTAGPLLADLKLAMIETRDIASVAAEELLNGEFKGKQTRELLGERDLDYTEVTRIIADSIGRPGLQYVQVSDDQFREAAAQMGMSRDVANLVLDMAAALNSGHMRALEPRSARTTTPTSYETFVTEELAPAYHQQVAA